MTTVREMCAYIDSLAPFKLAESNDNLGLIIGDMDDHITSAAVALDITADVLQEAVDKGTNTIVTHHPVIYGNLFKLHTDSIAAKLVRRGINVIAVHTNIDIVKGGLSDILLNLLQVSGYEVLKQVHPNGMGYGRVANLDFGITAADLAEVTKGILNCNYVRYTDCGKLINRLAVCTGAGSGFLELAVEKGCDAYITGDVKHHQFIDAKRFNISLIDAGHFHTENIFCLHFAEKLSQQFPDTICYVAETNQDPVKYI